MGTDKPNPEGATGGFQFDQKLERADLALLERSIRQGWAIPDGVREALPRVVREIMDNPDSSDRDRLRAAEIMSGLNKDNREALIELIKTRRLIGGQSTENVTFRFAEGVDQGGI